MKTLTPYLVLLIITLFVACSPEDVTLQEDSVNLVIENSNKEASTLDDNQTKDFGIIPSRFTTPETIELERKMQWVAYITADVLYNDPYARTQFINQMQGTNPALKPKIVVNDVLGNDISDSDPFKSSFRSRYTAILLEIFGIEVPTCRPGGATERPPTGSGGPTSNPIFIDGQNQVSFTRDSITVEEVEAMVDEFMNYIVTEECLEIYFPIGIFNAPEYTSITSTAHPLVNRATENIGYYRIAPVDDCPVQIVNYVDVNKTYAESANGPIVIVRPKRVLDTFGCDYSEYNFDFTTFMN